METAPFSIIFIGIIIVTFTNLMKVKVNQSFNGLSLGCCIRFHCRTGIFTLISKLSIRSEYNQIFKNGKYPLT